MTIDEEKLATGVVQRVLNRAVDYVEKRIFDEVAAYNARQPEFLKDYCRSKISEISSVKNILYSREAVDLQSIYVAASLEISFEPNGRPITVPDSLFSDIFFKSIESTKDKIAEHLAQSQTDNYDETDAHYIDPKILSQLQHQEQNKPKRKTSAYIISGGAGAGKTIFLKHMCLSAIESRKPYLPIYIEVRRLSSASDLIISMVDEINRYGEIEISRKYLMAALRAGLFLYLR
ncbi:hypothetical protein M2324_004019 [Rhodovulum sulfidophilum]|uniref:hypothetical protein n=1 Tax=Rhodovulum sulfidophilum TaxID=35806 RepID=UPI000A71E7AC|nr:hypothetical protein [Rhodovulum sulfidophilum]MCW2305592.1 hypothetical protein [Rhodovulum sulfidophilum]